MDGDMQSVEVENSVLGKLKIPASYANTFFTIATTVICALTYQMVWSHLAEAKDSDKNIAQVVKEAHKEIADRMEKSNNKVTDLLKEMARGQREQNCLQSMPQNVSDAQRQRNADNCRRISQ